MLLAALTTFFTLCISQTSADTVLGTGTPKLLSTSTSVPVTSYLSKCFKVCYDIRNPAPCTKCMENLMNHVRSTHTAPIVQWIPAKKARAHQFSSFCTLCQRNSYNQYLTSLCLKRCNKSSSTANKATKSRQVRNKNVNKLEDTEQVERVSTTSTILKNKYHDSKTVSSDDSDMIAQYDARLKMLTFITVSLCCVIGLLLLLVFFLIWKNQSSKSIKKFTAMRTP